MDEHKVLFEKFISSLECDATKKYVALIKSVVDEESKREC